jgi:hypothetical protein
MSFRQVVGRIDEGAISETADNDDKRRLKRNAGPLPSAAKRELQHL